jgi:hypothetical protein
LSLFAEVLAGRLRTETQDELVLPDDMPAPFLRVLTYVSQLFGQPAPLVVKRAELGSDIHVTALRLVVGPEALKSPDRAELAFRLGRAILWLADGRSAAAAIGARRLRTFLYAAMTLARPDLNAPDPDGEIAKERSRFEADPALKDRLLPHIERLLSAKDAQISLSRHLRGLGRTADRAGLLACGDILVAAPVLRAEGDAAALDELLDFALSEEHLALRDRVGLSVAV